MSASSRPRADCSTSCPAAAPARRNGCRHAGLEWAWRIWLEPRRLFWRYLTTNPRALYLLFNKSRPSITDRTARLMSDRPAILVTGGAGYIGSHCCRALDAAGYLPVCYDNFSTGHRSFVTGALVAGDIADKATLARAFAEHDITAVMHFAASSLVGESVVDPQKYYSNNLAGTLSLLDAMREAGCNRLVFSSTGAVYGNADSKALPEDYACAPINPYGASKWMIERVLADYRGAYGLGSFALRYFNASGADPCRRHRRAARRRNPSHSPRHDGTAGARARLCRVRRRL